MIIELKNLVRMAKENNLARLLATEICQPDQIIKPEPTHAHFKTYMDTEENFSTKQQSVT